MLWSCSVVSSLQLSYVNMCSESTQNALVSTPKIDIGRGLNCAFCVVNCISTLCPSNPVNRESEMELLN